MFFLQCLGEKFRGDRNRRVNGGRNRSEGAYAQEQNLTNEGHVCLCAQRRDYEPVFMFPAAQCRLATAHWVSTTPFRPPQTHIQRATNHPHGSSRPPNGSSFARVPLSAAPVKRVSLVRDWWVTPSFDVKSLEHACSSTKDREREREGEKQRRELLNNFSHMLALQKGRGGERIPFRAPWGAELRRMDETITAPERRGLRHNHHTLLFISWLFHAMPSPGFRPEEPEGKFIAQRLRFHSSGA